MPLCAILYIAFFKKRKVSILNKEIAFKVVRKKVFPYDEIVAIYTFTTQGSIRIHIYNRNNRMVDIGFGFREDDKRKIIGILRRSVDPKKVDFQEDISIFKLVDIEKKLKKEYQTRSGKKHPFRSWSEKKCPVCQGTMELRADGRFNAKCEDCNFIVFFDEFTIVQLIPSLLYMACYLTVFIFIASFLNLSLPLIMGFVGIMIVTVILIIFWTSGWIVRSKRFDRYIEKKILKRFDD